MNKLKFIDRMAQGKLSRRDMLRGAAAFGVGMTMMPVRSRADSVLTCMEWSGYDQDAFFKSYVSKHGKAPNFSIFANEEEALQKVRGGFNADIMHPCTYSVFRFTDAKIAEPIDTSKLSNWPDIFPALQKAPGVVVDGNVVMTPCDWGNSSIAYRTDLVDADFNKQPTWTIFTDDKYAGRVAMIDDTVAAEIAGLINGLDHNQIFNMTDDDFAKAKPLVEKIVKNSRFLWKDPTEIDQALASGEIVAAYAWNETAKTLKEQGIAGAYAVPKEGIFTWLCGLTLLSTGKASKDDAYDFLDAWLSPETGKALIEQDGYGHSNKKAFQIADPKKVAALGITDPEAALNAGILLQKTDVPKYTKFWEDIKAAK